MRHSVVQVPPFSYFLPFKRLGILQS
uniref:Uncharacterized protein n=1 Tax=Anguilla anguilla TaxID=7936 RepID=A0A0E9P714_ANGAN